MEDITILAPGRDAFSITASNSDFIPKTRGIYISGGTTLTVVMAGGGQVQFTNLAPGVVHPLQVIQVRSTGTNATGIIGII